MEFEKWFNLDNPSIRVGPISTSALLSKFINVNEQDLHITEDGYIFLTLFHTVIFTSNNDAYGNDSGSTIHFYTSILKEKFYQSFGVDSIYSHAANGCTVVSHSS
ncbi:hypothetical protein PFDG_05254 [Plasmodium falciparum Dd2]|uniref:Uncharacterized protein n=1 Tax=Plasmodium falciparum (isolate Dd2) TaxID=57267 RepID=A0A0L7MA17_PLAF4|nr:hypothetical protein PFDG_05254 [Plasmodium falciparum Dd2]